MKTLALYLVAVAAALAQSFTTVANFDSASGGEPFYMSLVQGTDGDFCGTTAKCGASGYGTIFKVTPSGTLTPLHSFAGPEGSIPVAGLVLAADGMFYGATSSGGARSMGAIFKITPDGILTSLHSFAGTDGNAPYAPLIQVPNGDFYGTTTTGGIENHGTIFKITPSGNLATVHFFQGTDGSAPYAPLVQATDGNFYGTTEGDDGTVFSYTPGGTLTNLYSFNLTDGRSPYAGLVQATDGNLYGTTIGGGAVRSGTIFQVTSAGTVTSVYSFCASHTCGQNPIAGLIQAIDGNFYGTTEYGGANGDGTIFRMAPSGAVTILHSFNETDGERPQGGLLQATDGSFYGTTTGGGANGLGTVFRLAVGLAPFVKPVPVAGAAGTTVRILGNKLTGATNVTFNGTEAAFAVVASSEIIATVPAGATTGTIQVTTPLAVLSSNAAFRVLP